MQNAAGGEGQGGHKAGVVSFRSVPAFVFAREVMVDTREWGPVQVDIAYGGAFYAVLAADSIGLDLGGTPARLLADAGAAITEATAAQLRLTHPEDRSEEHTSELQSLMRISSAVFCLKKKT